MDILELFVRATGLAIVLLILAPLVGRRSPAVRHLVLIVGFSWMVLLPLQGLAGPRWRPAVLPPAEIRGVGNGAVVQDLAAVAESYHLPSGRPERAPGRAAPSSRPGQITLVLTALAVLGTVLLLGLRAMGVFAVNRLVRRGRLLDPADSVSVKAASASRMLGRQRPIPVIESSDCGAPFAAGLFRPMIAVPPDFKDWAEERQHAVLLHEAAHVIRRDPWWRMLGEVALAVHWWNPMVRIAVRSGVTTSELACDDLVVSAGVVPERYAEDLVGLSRLLSGRPLVAVPVLHLSHSDLPVRVTRLLQREGATAPQRFTFVMAGVAALSLGTAAGTVSPRQGSVAGSPESTLNISNGGPEISSNAAGVQARWVVNGRHVGIFVTGDVDVKRLLRSAGDAGSGMLVVIEEGEAGVRTYRWPTEGQPPRWVSDVLKAAAEQLVGLPQHGGEGSTPVPSAQPEPRVRRPGSSLSGLPAFSSDPGASVVQAGWIEQGKRYGFFARGEWYRSGASVTSADRPAWLYAFRLDPVSQTLEEVTIDPSHSGNSLWVAAGVSRINAVLGARH